MYLGLLFVTLYYGLTLAGVAFVPGLAALGLALRDFEGRREGERGLGSAAFVWVVVHGFSRRVCVVLLATSCGLVGAGLLSVGLNVLLVIIAVIWDSVSGVANPEVDMTLVGLLYFGGLSVGFLVFFAFAMNGLVRWFKPKAL